MERSHSYRSVSKWKRPMEPDQPSAAFEVPKARKLGQVVVAVVYSFLAAGIVFGYAAFKPVLISEGVYRDQCSKEELEKDVFVCYRQELRLNLMFTIATVITNVTALPAGTILDRYGPRINSIAGSFFLALGCLFFAFAANLPFDGYIVGYALFALGGPSIFLSTFHLSNTFPQSSGLVLALLTGAFDASPAIFLCYRLVYATSDGTFHPKKFFLIYLIVPAFTLLAQIFLMPSKSYKSIIELIDGASNGHSADACNNNDEAPAKIPRNHQQQVSSDSASSETTALLNNGAATEQLQAEEKKRKRSGVYGVLHGRTAFQQICTPWFILISLFLMIQMTRTNYFIATVRPQYEYLLRHANKAARINGFLDFGLPLGGVLSVPFIGTLLDNTSTVFALALLVGLAAVIGAFGLLPYTWAAYANVSVFVLYRPLLYTAVSDYAAKVFGFSTFGKVYGFMICISGLFNFVQAGLDLVTHKTFEGNPIPINIILEIVSIVFGIALVSYVWWKTRSFRRNELEDEAEESTDTLVPGADSRVTEDHRPFDVHRYGTRDAN